MSKCLGSLSILYLITSVIWIVFAFGVIFNYSVPCKILIVNGINFLAILIMYGFNMILDFLKNKNRM